MRVVGLASRVLTVQLDGVEPVTAEEVARAVDRLGGAMIDWHDAVARGPGSPTAGPATADLGPVLGAAYTVDELTDSGRLDAVNASAQAAASELHAAARGLRSSTTALSTSVAAEANRLADLLLRLADSLDELALVAARERQRLARHAGPESGDDPSSRQWRDRSAALLRRAEHAVRHAATTTLPA